jgi:hypothetical protein
MLKSLGLEKYYISYMMLSKYTHGTQDATELYRHNLGTEKTFREFITPQDWHRCLGSVWFSFGRAGNACLFRSGSSLQDFLSAEFAAEADQAIRAIQESDNSLSE